MATATNDIVTHGGRQYRLELLARGMDGAEREAIHSSPDCDGPQHFWDAFAAAYPESAAHLIAITPTIDLD